MSDLKKFQTPPAFPKLGVRGPRQSPYLVTDYDQVVSKVKGGYSALKVNAPKADRKESLDVSKDKFLQKPSVGLRFRNMPEGISPSYAMGNELRTQVKPYPEGRTPGPTHDLATVQHENFHDIMGQVEAKHGPMARYNLANNVLSTLLTDPRYNSRGHNHAVGTLVAHVSRLYSPESSMFAEEVLAKLHNMLNDPYERQTLARVHYDSPELPREVHQGLKGAWRQFQNIAAEADESWLRPKFNESDDIEKSEATPSSPPEVSLVLVVDGTGRILLGKRNDTGAWTMPGGHIDPGESPEAAAIRELAEETGLTPVSITALKTQEATPQTPKLHCFTAVCNGVPTGYHDPDQECEKWEWVDARGGLPSNVYDKLHGPQDDSNVLKQLFDLKRSEQVWLDAGFADLRKADSEVSSLLSHPDPRERVMAMKLGSVTPADVAVAILDPDEWVWRQAMLHPRSGLALDVLAGSTRDASGAPLFDRHDALLADPRLHPRHVAAMRDATRRDSGLPPLLQVRRAEQYATHPLLNDPTLLKAEQTQAAAHKLIASTAKTNFADASAETPMPHLGHFVEAYHQHVGTTKPVAVDDGKPAPGAGYDEDPDLLGGATSKVAYDLPVHGSTEAQRFLVKPYHDLGSDKGGHKEVGTGFGGWAEATSQAMYHAGGIGHLHQPSFVAPHGTDEHQVPALVIPVAHGAKEVPWLESGDVTPEVEEQARRIGLMDFLTGNHDRHTGNLLFTKNGDAVNLLAIDNAGAFDYPEAKYHDTIQSYLNEATAEVHGPPSKNPEFGGPHGHVDSWNNTLGWWRHNGPAIRRAFEERSKLLTDPPNSRHVNLDDPEAKELFFANKKHRILATFRRRADMLDRIAAGERQPQNPDWRFSSTTGEF